MQILELINGVVVISPEALTIPEFKVLWEADRSKNKEVATREITFIYMMVNYKSIYQSYDPQTREAIIKEDLFKGINFIPSQAVKDAMIRYDKFQDTLSLRLLKGARHATEQTTGYFNSVDYSKTDPNGKLLFNIKDVTKALGDIPKIIDALDKTEERVKKEQRMDTKVKAGGQEGLLADD